MIPEPKYKRGDWVRVGYMGEHQFKISFVKIEDAGIGWQVFYKFAGFYSMGWWNEESILERIQGTGDSSA